MDNGGRHQIGIQNPEFRPGQDKIHFRPSIRDIMAMVSERDAAVVERNLAFSEKKQAVRERGIAIMQRDAAILERDNAIKERDHALAYLHSLEHY